MNETYLEKLREEYRSTEIPPELDKIVKEACLSASRQKMARLPLTLIGLAASLLIMFSIAVNVSPVFAEGCEGVPVLSHIARIVKIGGYHESDGSYKIDINIPEISGLANRELERILNEELKAEGDTLYREIKENVAELHKSFGGDYHLTFTTFFDVLASNEEIFSLGIAYHYGSGSSNTTRKFYNVNQKTGELIKLSDLFIPGSGWLEAVNEELILQMKSAVDDNGDSIYWVNDDDLDDWKFRGIGEEHEFYINNFGELVIPFDKYEVAPGTYGTPTITIPHEAIVKFIKADAPLA